MRSLFANLRSLVLPNGATSGRRILLDGLTGIITFFDSLNRVRLQLGGLTDALAGAISFGTAHPDQSALAQILPGTLGAGGTSNARLRIIGPDVTGAPAGDAILDFLSGSPDGTEIAALRLSDGASAMQLAVGEGTNLPMGLATLVAGAVVVNTALITANTRVFLSRQTPGGALGDLDAGTRVAGTSFTITSTSGTETSTVAWLLLEPF